MEEGNKKKTIADLIRKDLETVSLEEIKALESLVLTQEELKERASDIEMFWKKWGKDMILLIYWEELNRLAKTEGESHKFKQGVLEGIAIIKAKLEGEADISQSRFDKPKEEPPLGTELE